MLAKEASFEHYSQEPFRNTADYQRSIQNAPDGNHPGSALSLSTPTDGPFRQRPEKREGPAPSLLLVWVTQLRRDKTPPFRYWRWRRRKEHSRADGIRINCSEEGAGIATAGRRLGGPGLSAFDVQP